MKNIFLFLMLSFVPCHIFALEIIDITQGTIKPIPIAINDFENQGEVSKNLSNNIASVITADLERSGLFQSINKEAFLEKLDSALTLPNFISWRQINATAVLAGSVSFKMNEKLEVMYRLWDPYLQKEIAGKSYVYAKEHWRVLAHKIADDVYSRLTGEKGYFNTRIAYVAETGNYLRRIKRLAIMDQDGANEKILTDGRHMALTPRFSPDNRYILYLSYATKVPSVFLRDLSSGRERKLGEFPGMSFAPRFSPDGNEVIFSVSKGLSTNLYTLNIKTIQQNQLTSSPFIDTSPFYSPDGNKIVFSSDRSGAPQIYIMNRDGSDQKRITFNTGSYNTPVWSPNGQHIAFTRIANGLFYIGVIKPDGSGERLLASGNLIEGPSWSPNSRVIMYSSKERDSNNKLGKTTIHSIDISGYFERIIHTNTDATDPEWSSLLQ